MKEIIAQVSIESRIHLIRGKKVILDSDLSALYEVETKQLKRAVRRNIERFPEDFMFELTKDELEILRCQIGTSSWGGKRYQPFAFTEHGVAMLSGVLNSDRAVAINIQIMRAFVRIRNLVSDNAELKRAIQTIERRVNDHDKALEIAFNTLKKFIVPKELLPKEYSPEEKKKMGFGKDKRNHE
jgi:hypothetical protein